MLTADASEVDLSTADNASLATSAADDVWLANAVSVNDSCRLQVPGQSSAVVDRSSDMDDSSEDEQSTSLHISVFQSLFVY